jgi:tetratricopeptide (TPR) repeat protein
MDTEKEVLLMRKATTPLFIFPAVAMLLLLASCTRYASPTVKTYPITGQDAQTFAASLQPQAEDAGAHYRLGCFLQERKKHHPAIENFKAALAIDPGHVQAWNAMGVSRDILGDYGRAVEAYTAALRIDGRRADVRNNLGTSYLLQGRTDLAVENFGKAVALDGDNARYRNNLGLALARSGHYSEALSSFKAAGDEARAHANLARLHYREGRYADAQVHFGAASMLKASQPEFESGLQAAGIPGTIPGENQNKLSAPAAHPPAAVRFPAPERGPAGFQVIPAWAQGVPVRLAAMPPAADGLTVYRPSPAARVHGQITRPSVHRVLEAEASATLNADQARELLDLHGQDGSVSRVRIEVANGNGVRHMARNVGDFLRGPQVALMYLSNAQRFNHAGTTIYYVAGYLHEAYRIARQLPGRQRLEQVREIKAGKAEISILIGRDLVAHADLFRKG